MKTAQITGRREFGAPAPPRARRTSALVACLVGTLIATACNPRDTTQIDLIQEKTANEADPINDVADDFISDILTTNPDNFGNSNAAGNDSPDDSADNSSNSNAAGNDSPDDSADNSSNSNILRDTSQIVLNEEQTISMFGRTWGLDLYRNSAYGCGLTGHYSFLVMNPANDADAEAPLWAYLHGGGAGYYDDTGTYVAVKDQTEDTYNHEETFTDLFDDQVMRNSFNTVTNQPIDSTLRRRIEEGYRVLVVSLCDHDMFSGLGTPYTNHPTNPTAEVNGLEATMAAIDYVAANYPTTQVWAHGTSAGSIGVWALASSYGFEGTALTGVVADSWITSPRVLTTVAAFAGEPGYPFGADMELQGLSDKVGFFVTDIPSTPEAQIADRDFREVPVLFIAGNNDPFCGGNQAPLAEAVADGLSNCDWLHDGLRQVIDAQVDSPHDLHVVNGFGHVPTNEAGPINDVVDDFIIDILTTNPDNFGNSNAGGNGSPNDSSGNSGNSNIVRDASQIVLNEEQTISMFGQTWELAYYVNDAYQCGLSGDYSFMVMNPGGNPDATAPLWVYLHGGGQGYWDDNGDYQGLPFQNENSWNHQETLQGLISGVQARVLDANGQLKDQTLVRRIKEGYRLLVVSYCDHDFYSGLGTPYPNHPTNPNAQVNGLQATMAAIDYTSANYPTTHVWAHGTSAGGPGVWALASSYGSEGAPLTGVVADSGAVTPGIYDILDEYLASGQLKYMPTWDPAGTSEKIGFFASIEIPVYPEAQIVDRDFREVPSLFMIGSADPFCAGDLGPVPEAMPGLTNCEHMYGALDQAIANQANSPHEMHFLPNTGHVPTHDPGPANDIVDEFIAKVLGNQPAPPF